MLPVRLPYTVVLLNVLCGVFCASVHHVTVDRGLPDAAVNVGQLFLYTIPTNAFGGTVRSYTVSAFGFVLKLRLYLWYKRCGYKRTIIAIDYYIIVFYTNTNVLVLEKTYCCVFCCSPNITLTCSHNGTD